MVKNIKSIRKKEVKLSLFADGMMLYTHIENPRIHEKYHRTQTNKFSKAAGYKINM